MLHLWYHSTPPSSPPNPCMPTPRRCKSQVSKYKAAIRLTYCPSKSSKVLPYMPGFSGKLVGSILPPDLPALSTVSSISALLDAERHSRTSVVEFGAIVLLVGQKPAKRSWVMICEQGQKVSNALETHRAVKRRQSCSRSGYLTMTLIWSLNTMQEVCSSQNMVFLVAPMAS